MRNTIAFRDGGLPIYCEGQQGLQVTVDPNYEDEIGGPEHMVAITIMRNKQFTTWHMPIHVWRLMVKAVDSTVEKLGPANEYKGMCDALRNQACSI